VPSKINDLTTSVTAGHTSAAAASSAVDASATGAAAATAAGAAGEVHITDTATHLAALEQSLRDAPAVDTAKVALLRNAIEQGQYQVQPEHVATQFLQMEHALSGLKSEVASGAPVFPDAE
jgi:negative regulator of flagellin synthesis FlgM